MTDIDKVMEFVVCCQLCVKGKGKESATKDVAEEKSAKPAVDTALFVHSCPFGEL